MWVFGMDPNDEIWGAEIRGNCIYNKKLCIRIAIGNHVVLGIENELTYEIALEEAKQYLQKPDYVEFNTSVEKVSCRMVFIWEKKQLILYSQEYTDYETFEDNCQSEKLVRPDNTIIIGVVRYVSPLWIDLHMF
jgi:hypothetical protein